MMATLSLLWSRIAAIRIPIWLVLPVWLVLGVALGWTQLEAQSARRKLDSANRSITLMTGALVQAEAQAKVRAAEAKTAIAEARAASADARAAARDLLALPAPSPADRCEAARRLIDGELR